MACIYLGVKSRLDWDAWMENVPPREFDIGQIWWGGRHWCCLLGHEFYPEGSYYMIAGGTAA